MEKEYLEGLISPSPWCDSRSRNQSKTVDSTGVRLGFINLGEWSDGLQRKGS